MSEGKEDKQELLKLYDIRVREIHHYNTMIWAFPIAFAGLLAAQYNFLAIGAPAIVVAGFFNLSLCYVFSRHVGNFNAVKDAADNIGDELAKQFPEGAFPNFENSGLEARYLMRKTLWSVSLIFLIWAVLGLAAMWLPAENCIGQGLRQLYGFQS